MLDIRQYTGYKKCRISRWIPDFKNTGYPAGYQILKMPDIRQDTAYKNAGYLYSLPLHCQCHPPQSPVPSGAPLLTGS